MNIPRPDDEDDEDEWLDSPPRQAILPGLDISEVEITDRVVTWHEMKWRGKPMTLSKFRQLMAETLVDEERVRLRGELWFFVNHDPNRPPKPGHRQFIVRFGKQFRRSEFRIRHLEGHPSDRGRACEGDWPSPLCEMRSRHERLTLYGFIDRAMQGPAALPEGFNRSHRALAFPDHPPFAAFPIQADQELASGLEGAIDPGPDMAPPVARIQIPSAAERQQDYREMLRRYLATRSIEAGNPPEHWESLIEQNAEAARDYIARWNALMGELRSVEQLLI